MDTRKDLWLKLSIGLNNFRIALIDSLRQNIGSLEENTFLARLVGS